MGLYFWAWFCDSGIWWFSIRMVPNCRFPRGVCIQRHGIRASLPFSQYYVQNIETPLTLHVGAVETVNSGVYASNKVFTTKIAFIGDSGMFKIKEGSLTKDYDENTDRLVFTINGEAELNALSLSLGGADINSGDFDLPMNNNVSINIESGKVAINQNTGTLGRRRSKYC